MRFERALIMKGLLVGLGGYWPEDPGVDYQLYDEETGEPVTIDYKGEIAAIRGDDGLDYIVTDPQSLRHRVAFFRYRVDKQPTPYSVEYRAGWLHAMKQKIRRWPSEKVSEAYKYGWQGAWEEKRRK